MLTGMEAFRRRGGATLLLIVLTTTSVHADCLNNKTLNSIFEQRNNNQSIPIAGSCCMKDVCGLECPMEADPPLPGFGIAAAVSVALSFVVGACTFFIIKGHAVNFFVAGRSLPLWVTAMTLSAQSVDSNALLGNVDLSYRFDFYSGAVIPIGLGLSLMLNGLFLAHHVNQDDAMTLPDIFAKRYGRVVEVLVSLATVCSFLMLLAGNLVGFGVISSYIWGISEAAGIWAAAAIIWAYTACGGLFSVAYTDIVQAIIGWSGCLVMSFWLIAKSPTGAPAASIGFPHYVYPDSFGEGGACDLYNGTSCASSDACCYNIDLWCPGYYNNTRCLRYDRGAYPLGDIPAVHADQMFNPYTLDPYPNSIFWNWTTIFVLAVGNLGALDFQARCMASKSATGARIGCVIASLFTFLIGIPFAFLGGITRIHYGPDSVYSTLEADSCNDYIDQPTCSLWTPKDLAFLMLLTNKVPAVLGAWCLIGIISASMSTADGAILAMGTVMSHNVVRQFNSINPSWITPDNLLLTARLATVPCTLISTLIAAYYRSSHAAGGTGHLLIVAFDIVVATVVVPLFGCFYCSKPSPRAALLAIVGGAACRIILEFALPKDGSFALPYDHPAFYDSGPAASADYAPNRDVPSDLIWDPTLEPCDSRQFEDFTGVDAFASFLLGLLLFLLVQFLEFVLGRALFDFGDPYVKDTSEHRLAKRLSQMLGVDNSESAEKKREQGAKQTTDDLVQDALQEVRERASERPFYGSDPLASVPSGDVSVFRR